VGGRLVKATGPSLYITIRGDRALVRGTDAERVCRMVSTDGPRWSDGGRGWVITAATVADVLAYSQAAHLLAVVSDQSDDQAVPA
jgi:hypothetical protein